MFKNRRIKRGWMTLRVVGKISETHDTETLLLVDNEDNKVSFDYFSGQYLTLRFDTLAKPPLVRSYTMASAPSYTKTIDLTIKKEKDGLASTYLCSQVKPGDLLRARGPIGKFIYDYRCDKRSLVMFAGGSGVTPFMSILREYGSRLGQLNCPQKLTLIVSYKKRCDFIYEKELMELMNKKGINIVVSFTRQEAPSGKGFYSGRVSKELIETVIEKNYLDHTYLLCGPQMMMDDISLQLQNQDVAKEHIKTESFEN
jgi:ferredoxin-NADP reductase